MYVYGILWQSEADANGSIKFDKGGLYRTTSYYKLKGSSNLSTKWTAAAPCTRASTLLSPHRASWCYSLNATATVKMPFSAIIA